MKFVCNECDEVKEFYFVILFIYDDLRDDNGVESFCGGEGFWRMVWYLLLLSYDFEFSMERGFLVLEMFIGLGRLERVFNFGFLVLGGGKRFW